MTYTFLWTKRRASCKERHLYNLPASLVFLHILVLLLSTGCNTAASTLPSPLVGRYTYTPPAMHGYHGKLVYATTQFPASANPLFASSSADLALNAALWGQPVFYDQQFHIHPDQLMEVPLPENGGVQDGGKTVLLHLRHDLLWSDGQAITASDFAYWWHLNQNPDTGATTQNGYNQIAQLETPDPYTVILHMKHPFGPYLFYLPYAAPQHIWGKHQPIELQNIPAIYTAPVVTSGPYKLKSMQDGQSYTLVPNTQYVSSSFRGPLLAQLTFRSYETTVSLVQAVQQHKVDVTTGYMEDEGALLTHLPAAVHIAQTLAASYAHLEFNNAKPLFADVQARQAIQKAINVCDLLVSVLHTADCARRATQVEPQPSLYHDATIQPVTYSPASAKRLLQQSGWLPDAHGILTKNGHAFIIRLVTTQAPLRLAVAAYIQHALQALGIMVQVVSYPLNTFFDGYTKGGILATGAYDMALFTYANSPEPDDQYDVFHSSQIPSADYPTLSNYARINDAAIDSALMMGRNSVAFTDRVVAYHRFLERLAQQVYVVPLYVEPVTMTVTTRVHNVSPNPNQAIPTWNVADWWTA